MKVDIYHHFKIWLLLFLIIDAIVIVINGAEGGGDAPPITLLVTGGFMIYVPILVKQFSKTNILPSTSVTILISLYTLGILFVSLTRDDVITEMPRALITAVSIWSGLVLGTCIGSSLKVLKTFTSILLFFGVTVSILSIITGIGVISNLSSLSAGRDNRLWTIAFGIIDPICMFSCSLYLISQYYKKSGVKTKFLYIIFSTLALSLIFYSSTRSYLIQLAILLIFAMLSQVSKSLRATIVPIIVIFSVLLVTFITQVSDLSNVSILSQFGFVDASGSVSLEKSRSLLHDYLIQRSLSSPFLGVGINEIKQSAALIDDAAKTEYGYYLHIAAFGYIVAAPFYLVMLFGGFLRPLINLAKLPTKAIAKTFPIHGVAVGCFLAGFNGYYAQATAVAQFIALIFIGISIQLDSPVRDKAPLEVTEHEDLLRS
jgi:O-Antigen ligase